MAEEPGQASENHRRLVQDAMDAYNRRNPDGFVAFWQPGCEWHPFLTAREEGDPGYHGHNGLRAWFEDVEEMFDDYHGEVTEVLDVGGRIVGVGTLTARRRGSGAEVTSEVAWVLEVKDGRLLRGWAYNAHEDALRAARDRT